MIVLRFRVAKGTYEVVWGQYLKHVLLVFLGSIVIARLLFNIVCSTRFYAEPWAIWHVLVLVCATISKITPSQTINIVQVPKVWPSLHATRWRFVTIPLTPCYRAWPPLCMVSMHNTMVTWLLHYFSLFCFGCVKKIVRVGMYHTDGHCHWIEKIYKAYPFSVCTCSSNHVHSLQLTYIDTLPKTKEWIPKILVGSKGVLTPLKKWQFAVSILPKMMRVGTSKLEVTWCHGLKSLETSFSVSSQVLFSTLEWENNHH